MKRPAVREKNREHIARIIDYFIMTSILAFSLCYAIFWYAFAKLHVDVPGLNFPVFVGEILLLIDALLTILNFRLKNIKLTRWHCLYLVFLIWLFIKAVSGFFSFGPLAFRNAALFYYSIFLFIAYHAYRKEFFSQNLIAIMLIVLFYSKLALGYRSYYFYPVFILSFVLILNLKKTWIRYLMIVALFFVFPYQGFFKGSKSFLVGILAAAGFILFALLKCWRVPLRYKITIICMGTLIMSYGFTRFALVSQIQSLTNIPVLWKEIQEKEALIRELKQTYKPKDISVRLYNDERGTFDDLLLRVNPVIYYKNHIKEMNSKIDPLLDKVDDLFLKKYTQYFHQDMRDVTSAAQSKVKRNIEKLNTIILLKKVSSDQVKEISQLVDETEITMSKLEGINKEIRNTRISHPEISETKDDISVDEVVPTFEVVSAPEVQGVSKVDSHLAQPNDIQIPVVPKQEMQKPNDASHQGRPLQVEYSNMLFRLFIWRDMLVELWHDNLVWGVNLGKPQRSPSIEILVMAWGEWSKDGWIAPHNSYLHILYRAGVFGAAIIFALFGLVIHLIKYFLAQKSVSGILIMSIFVYWLTLCNFNVFLEFPYQAIPFWSFLGIVAAYYRDHRDSVQNHTGWVENGTRLMTKSVSKRLLITGVSGLLGNNLALCLRGRYDILGLYHAHPVEIHNIQTQRIDLTDSLEVKKVVSDFKPEAVIHAAAITNIDFCEEHKFEAYQSNVLATKNLVEAISDSKIYLVHISTDTVYAEAQQPLISETARVAPPSYYALTKLQAEAEALKNRTAVILRTNLFGWNIQDKFSLAEWVIHELASGKGMSGFKDVYFSSIYTFALAQVMEQVLLKKISGVYNCGSRSALSKYEFALAIARRFKLNEKLIKSILVDEFNFKAKRRKNLALDVSKIEKALGYRLPTLEECIENFYTDFKKGLPQELEAVYERLKVS